MNRQEDCRVHDHFLCFGVELACLSGRGCRFRVSEQLVQLRIRIARPVELELAGLGDVGGRERDVQDRRRVVDPADRQQIVAIGEDQLVLLLLEDVLDLHVDPDALHIALHGDAGVGLEQARAVDAERLAVLLADAARPDLPAGLVEQLRRRIAVKRVVLLDVLRVVRRRRRQRAPGGLGEAEEQVLRELRPVHRQHEGFTHLLVGERSLRRVQQHAIAAARRRRRPVALNLPLSREPLGVERRRDVGDLDLAGFQRRDTCRRRSG